MVPLDDDMMRLQQRSRPAAALVAPLEKNRGSIQVLGNLSGAAATIVLVDCSFDVALLDHLLRSYSSLEYQSSSVVVSNF